MKAVIGDGRTLRELLNNHRGAENDERSTLAAKVCSCLNTGCGCEFAQDSVMHTNVCMQTRHTLPAVKAVSPGKQSAV